MAMNDSIGIPQGIPKLLRHSVPFVFTALSLEIQRDIVSEHLQCLIETSFHIPILGDHVTEPVLINSDRVGYHLLELIICILSHRNRCSRITMPQKFRL